MKEEFAIELINEDFNQLLHSQITPEDYIQSLFRDDENLEILKTYCSYTQIETSGFMQLKNFHIYNVEFDKHSLTGKMTCNFAVSYYYISTDSEILRDESINWTYVINSANKMIAFNSD